MPKVVDHEERRRELAGAVLAVMRRGGVGAATVRSVAAEAGWTHGVTAHYFRSHDDLLLLAYRTLSARVDERALRQSSADARGRLLEMLVATLPIDDESALEVRIWLGFMGRIAEKPELATDVAAVHEAYLDRVEQLVAAVAAEEGGPEEGHRDLAERAIVHANGLGATAILVPETFGPERLRWSMEQFLETLLPPRG